MSLLVYMSLWYRDYNINNKSGFGCVHFKYTSLLSLHYKFYNGKDKCTFIGHLHTRVSFKCKRMNKYNVDCKSLVMVR